MPRKDGTLNISYGLAGNTLQKQIKAEGYPLPKNIKYLEKCRCAICTLKFLLPESLNNQLVKRLNKEVAKSVKEALGEE